MDVDTTGSAQVFHRRCVERRKHDCLHRVWTEANFESLSALLEATLPALRRRRGRFAVVASQAGLVGAPDNAAYSTAKFAVVGPIRHLAGQASEQDITYDALCTESPAADRRARSVRQSPRHRTAEEFAALRQCSVPVGRFATPHETAAAAVYLATADGHVPTILAERGGEAVW
ncbi:SDR family oxidoreductase [Amycolatopsis sp. FDAARGOS 1241]|uniref:SDR family oxidoreductase n=1 Tax=Amycolatopsis sp. FDAARGOS 1241 TaxID=2778070 RepID=UPI001951BE93|nr:SDR family oxidoreductase [Amycolatopsis sp. FDAARGOS 1241]QRP47895.1 SDR family oxidoreductase [Amycolatopsis sp. FDAARGOS 1241]